MNKLLLTNVDFYSIVENYENLYKNLSEYRQNKISRRKILTDKLLTLTSSSLIVKALSEIGVEEKNAVYEENSYGCPKISNVENFNFSISHSEEMAICAYSEKTIGCDIELIKYPNYKIVTRFFTKEEKDFLETLQSAKIKEKMFFHIWTGKEAISKALGKGIALGFSTFSLVEEGLIVDEITVEGKKLHLKFIENKNYMICVAAEDNEFEEMVEITYN